MSTARPLLTRVDAVVLGLALALVTGLWLLPANEAGSGRVKVVAPGQHWVLAVYPDRQIVIEFTGGHLLLEFAQGSVRVAESYCPRRVCMAHGWLGAGDDAIVCVPQQVVITRLGGKNCDAVTR